MASLPTGPFENAEAIYKGLIAMGLTANAAAGVAGNIYQESHGNPGISSSAGGGLFGETLQNQGSVSGGSLSEQLNALRSYIQANGSIADINANSPNPTAAATYFSDKYERPGIPAIQNRIDAAQWVAQAASTGNWAAGVSPSGNNSSGGGGGLLGIPGDIVTFFSSADTFVTKLMWLAKPASWLRIGAFLAGVALLLFGIHALVAANTGGSLSIQLPKIAPVPI